MMVLDASADIETNRRILGEIRNETARITRNCRETQVLSRNFSRSSLIGVSDDDENAAKLRNQTRKVIQRIVDRHGQAHVVSPTMSISVRSTAVTGHMMPSLSYVAGGSYSTGRMIAPLSSVAGNRCLATRPLVISKPGCRSRALENRPGGAATSTCLFGNRSRNSLTGGERSESALTMMARSKTIRYELHRDMNVGLHKMSASNFDVGNLNGFAAMTAFLPDARWERISMRA